MKRTKFQKIDVEIYSGGGIGCLSTSCPYSRECATHRSAGDFRSESGFTPEVKVKNDTFYCRTYNENPDTTINYGLFPENYKELNSGMLVFKDGKIELAEPWW